LLGAVHDPQLSEPPQPSGMVPQFLPAAAQVVGTHGVVPHLFAPAPPQNSPAGQSPQLVVPLQPSAIAPHSALLSSQVTWLAQVHWPELQVAGSVQVPQIFVLPQSSVIVPHSTPSSSHVCVLQPHAFGTPVPPQVFGASQPPQSSTVSQPSEAGPHSAPRLLQERGMHGASPHLLVPAPPQ
jgi:hypothetical protein